LELIGINMESSNCGLKTIQRILVAMACGASISALLIVVSNWGYSTFTSGIVHDLAGALGILLTIPSAMITSRLGYSGGLLDEYIVNGVLGALLFGGFVALWEFAIRNQDK
jgi:hypothetical protein